MKLIRLISFISFIIFSVWRFILINARYVVLFIFFVDILQILAGSKTVEKYLDCSDKLFCLYLICRLIIKGLWFSFFFY